MRQRGEDVFFLTGTDEHGEPVAQAAEKLGHRAAGARRPKRARGSRSSCRRSTPRTTSSSAPPTPSTRRRSRRSCSGSTTTATSTRGPTRAGTARGAPTSRPSPRSAPGNTCPIHKIPLEREREENWFFQLSSFQEQLERLYAERPDFVRPEARYNEALSFINGGLRGRLAVAAEADLGREPPVGPRAGDLRVVRRAAQLRHRAQLRPRGRGPDRALLARASTSSARTSSSSTPSTGPRS